MTRRPASRSAAIPRPWGAVGVVSTLVVGLVVALEAPAVAVNDECGPPGGLGVITCSYTNSNPTTTLTFVVPDDVTSIEVELKAGDGGSAPSASGGVWMGGTGGLTQGTLSDLESGETLGIFVGGEGASKTTPCTTAGGAGGLSGGEDSGGDGGQGGTGACGGAGGGGASFITRGVSLLPSQVLAAAGGGGGASRGAGIEPGTGGDGGSASIAPGDGLPEGGGEGGDNNGLEGEEGVDDDPGFPDLAGGGGGGGGYPRSGDGGDTGAGGGGGCGAPDECPEEEQDAAITGAYREASPGYVLINYQGPPPGNGPGNGQPPPNVPVDPNPNRGGHGGPSSNDPNPNTNPGADPQPLPGMDPATATARCKPEKKICTVSVSGPDSRFKIDAEDGSDTAILFATMNGNWRPASVEASGKPNCPDYAEQNSDWVQFGFFEPERGKTWHKTGHMTQRQKMKRPAAEALAKKLQVCFAAPYTFPTRPGYRLGSNGPDRMGVLPECGSVRAAKGRPAPCVVAREIVKVKGGWTVRITFKIPANGQDPKALG